MSSPFQDLGYRETLDNFHDRCVVQTREERRSRNAEFDQFARFLHSDFSHPGAPVAKVLKSGSLAKGTAIREASDVDVVMVLNNLSNIDRLVNSRDNHLNRMNKQVQFYPWRGSLEFEKRTDFSLTYFLNDQKVDILPALNIESTYGSPQAVFTEISQYEDQIQIANDFSASLAPLQIDFVKSANDTVKRVIRLLKFWKNESEVDIRSYTLELMAVHEAARMRAVHTDGLFRQVLTRLAKCRSVKVAFDAYYNSYDYVGMHRAPYVLDPANPYMDTMAGKDAGHISEEAQYMLDVVHEHTSRVRWW